MSGEKIVPITSRDARPIIAPIIKPAPPGFTRRVMEKIEELPVYIGGPTPPDDDGGQAR